MSYQLWSPAVRSSDGKLEYNQFEHLKRVQQEIKSITGETIDLIINSLYVDAIAELRQIARDETKELKSPIMRFLQIEEWARKNLERESKRSARVGT